MICNQLILCLLQIIKMFNVYNTQKEKELVQLLEEVIKKDGYEIIRVRTFKGNREKKCQIMIDKVDDTQVGIADCENVNKVIIEILKLNDLGLSDYTIEVSSPGIDRPLTRLKDFIKHKGKLIKINTLFKVLDKKNFKGYIEEVKDEYILMKTKDEGDIITIRFDSILEAYLQYEHNIN